jgi:hypothetical protein
MYRMPRLDDWLPDPTIRTHHRRAAAAEPGRLWDCAAGVRLADTKTLGRLARWRIPDTPPERTFHEVFRAYPFTVLEEAEHMLLSGLCGRIWTLARDYPNLSGPQDFLEWDQRGTVRVLFAHWVQGASHGRAELVSEARVAPVDVTARPRLRAIWALVGPFERLVAAEGLSVATRRAEAR